MGILDQISILRSPATADLKQNQYSTKMVQLAGCVLIDVYHFDFSSLGFGLAVYPSRGLQRLLSRWILIARKLKNHPRGSSQNQ